MNLLKTRLILALAICASICPSLGAEIPTLRIGVIGLDTSHVRSFAEILHNTHHKEHVPGARIVVAYKGGSPDIEQSRNRIDRFAEEAQQTFGIRLVDTISEVVQASDAIMILSLDGRKHLPQFKAVLKARKPVFIDKPLGGSLAEVLEIARLARESGVPVFSSSSLRFYPGVQQLLQENVGRVRGAISYGPAHYEKTHPDLFWYGIHPAESLFAVMGPGCESVVRTHTRDTDVVTGIWRDGRTGVLYGLRNGRSEYRVTLFGTDKILTQTEDRSYAPLVREIIEFFRTGQAPVSLDETVELFAFLEAADESKRRGGVPVTLQDVLHRHASTQP